MIPRWLGWLVYLQFVAMMYLTAITVSTLMFIPGSVSSTSSSPASSRCATVPVLFRYHHRWTQPYLDMDDPESSKPFCWRLFSLWSVCGIVLIVVFTRPVNHATA